MHSRPFCAMLRNSLGNTMGCVIKDDKRTIVRRVNTIPEDPVIVECTLESDQSPSWFLIFYGVWKHWHKLVAANIET